MQYLLLGALIVFISVPSHAQNAPSLTSSSLPHYQGIGRIATPAEVNAWDIDVRPDFVGLPKGSGSVAQGQALWDIKCASCHGTFGESNEIFTPIVGGTTLADMKSGRVLALNDNKQPQRTTLMKVSTLSSLWDYI
ncbi:MAG: cytochrome C, partial [Polynucleobacter sp.]